MPLGIDLTRPPRSRTEQLALVEAVRCAPAAESETNYVEWKRTLDLTDKAALVKIAAAVLGFSNRMPDVAARFLGGCACMVVGVEPGSLAGVDPVDAAKLEARIAAYVGANVHWRPDYVELNGSSVLVVTVEAPRWGEPAHPVRKTFTDGPKTLLKDGAILVRRHASTVEANAEEVEALARRAGRRVENDLAVDVRLADDSALRRVDVGEDAVAQFSGGRERAMLGALNNNSAFGLLGAASSPIAALGEYRSEEEYRSEVAAYGERLAEALPGVLLARSVLHSVACLRLVVVNETERTFTGVRVELTLPGGFDVCTWEHEAQDETELPRSPTPFGQGSALLRDGGLDLIRPLGIPMIRPPWTPDAEVVDGRTRVYYADKEVRAEGLSELPEVWLLLAQDAPEELAVEWQATAKEATKRLRGTITVPVARDLVTIPELLEAPPDSD